MKPMLRQRTRVKSNYGLRGLKRDGQQSRVLDMILRACCLIFLICLCGCSLNVTRVTNIYLVVPENTIEQTPLPEDDSNQSTVLIRSRTRPGYH
jgi:hypothetical protein